jgi:hypothetical protein
MSDPVEEQLAAWKKDLQEDPERLEPVKVAKRVMGQKFQMAVAMRLGVGGFHAVLKIVPVPGTDVAQYEAQLREELDRIGWQFVTIPSESQPGAQRRFAMAPLTQQPVTITYHTTLTAKHKKILGEGLLPSSEAIRQTDFPDTDGKMHICEALTGDGSASRWVKIFCERYSRKPEEYAILRVDLTGLEARVYRDVRSNYGLVVDGIDRIPPERITLVRLGEEADLASGPGRETASGPAAGPGQPAEEVGRQVPPQGAPGERGRGEEGQQNR